MNRIYSPHSRSGRTKERFLLSVLFAAVLLFPFQANADSWTEQVSQNGDTLNFYGGPGTLLGKFQTESMLPDLQGWVSHDGTQTHPELWNVSTYNAGNLDLAVVDNHAWWCGEMFASCADDTIGGYGNIWQGSLAWDGQVANPDLPAIVTINGIANIDTEPGYDQVSLQFKTSENHFVDVLVLDGTVDGLVISEDFTYLPEDYLGSDGKIRVQFSFKSDGWISDEDCGWPSRGACQVDNLQISIHQEGYPVFESPIETCEPGTPVNWKNIPNPGYGNFAKLWVGLDDLDPDVSNSTPQWAFIDDGVVEPGTGGTPCRQGTGCYGPDSFVVDIWGGLQDDLTPGLLNVVTSPAIDISGSPFPGKNGHLILNELMLEADIYLHSDPGCGEIVGLRFDVLSTDDATGETGWLPSYQEFIVSDPGPEYQRVGIVFPRSSLVPSALFAKIEISALDLRTWWCHAELFSTPAPYFDNVRLQGIFAEASSTTPDLSAVPSLVAYPNPFNAETSFHFELQRQEKVRIDIFDIRGRVVKQLVHEVFEKGFHSIDWNGRQTNGNPVSSGSYYVRGVFGGQIQTVKISLLK